MRHINKYHQIESISKALKYIVEGKNKDIRDMLLKEQNKLCAYTETYLGRTDQQDIDHFNPQLKGTEEDNYFNWFLCKAQWNKEKSNKWENYQPVLNPCDKTLESRIIYYKGNYILDKENDKEAKNLIALLKLDDFDLSEDRRKYIVRLKEDIDRYGETPEKHIKSLLLTNPERVYFIRAIEEEFNFKVFE